MMNPFDVNDMNNQFFDQLESEGSTKFGCLSSTCYLFLIMAVLLFCSFFCSCSSQKNMIAETKDSIVVHTKTEIVYVPDTTYITIPAQTSEVVVKDSVSHLENEYATSDARINADGTLYHFLATKPQEKPVEFQKPIVTRDSIRTEVKWRTNTKVVEVERKKTWWEQTTSYGFYALVLLIIVIYRKQIWKILSALIR